MVTAIGTLLSESSLVILVFFSGTAISCLDALVNRPLASASWRASIQNRPLESNERCPSANAASASTWSYRHHLYVHGTQVRRYTVCTLAAIHSLCPTRPKASLHVRLGSEKRPEKLKRKIPERHALTSSIQRANSVPAVTADPERLSCLTTDHVYALHSRISPSE